MNHTHPTANRPNIDKLESDITELAGHLAAANYRLLVLIREFDEAHGWSGGGVLSCAHWLSWKVGTNLGAAREKVRVAHALKNLPQISEAFSMGSVSYSKVRAMTRVATLENEEFLLTIARHGTARHVEQLVRHYRKVTRTEALQRDNEVHKRRSLSVQVDDDGMVILKGRFTPEQGASIIQALDKAMDDCFEESRKQEAGKDEIKPEPYSARRADAMEKLADSFLCNKQGRQTGGDKYLINVHTTVETLQEGGEQSESELGGIGNVSAESSRRMSCDCGVVHTTENTDGDTLSIGRKARTVPPSIRRALDRRDGGCAFPGCSCTRFVDAHHIIHWADGGETKLSNLVLLCRRHHRLVHEGGFAVRRLDDDQIQFTRPDGSVLLANGDRNSRGNVVSLTSANRKSATKIDSTTIRSRWAGETIDYGLAVDSLLWRDSASPGVSAETKI
ncbi:MAG: HNH endonuclease [Lysobacteraceae bacterium]|nr:MAG: HNH endonuclease [Xanthomonadaceae bacterium]